MVKKGNKVYLSEYTQSAFTKQIYKKKNKLTGKDSSDERIEKLFIFIQ